MISPKEKPVAQGNQYPIVILDPLFSKQGEFNSSILYDTTI